ncbi:cytochrome b5 reductase 4-like [Diadema antillarum]|uniref:cytochrome b5 reductase 4-like n=1 Tax=Diadema antillarum TaxID=105358 RepID=UPI003A839286
MQGKETMNPQVSLTVPKQQFPAINSPQRASSSTSSSSLLSPASAGASGSSSRVKVALKPGRSLMDWVRLGKQQGKKLNGVQGKRMDVTEEELAKHNKIHDGWLSIRGQVYNVTPYMEYHPGGAEELERGLGKDATDLFNQIHRWVNVESMLEKCHIGPLQKKDPMASFKIPGQKLPPKETETSNDSTLNWPDTVEDMPWYMCKLRKWNHTKAKAKHDWYQVNDQVVISIYAKSQFFVPECLVTDVEDRRLRVTVYLDNMLFTLHLELQEHIFPSIKVKITKNMITRCDLWLKKKNPNIKWTTLGLPLDDHKRLDPITDIEPFFRRCTLRKRVKVTHDTYLFTFEFPEGVRFGVPIAHHIHLQATINGEEVSRQYTPVVPSLLEPLDEPTDNQSQSTVHLMIKIYPQGVFTQHLATLREGDEILMSNYEGTVKDECSFKKVHTAYFIAAGTGITPMIKLIRKGLMEEDTSSKLKLLLFNKTEKDIMWREDLDKCVEKSNGRFEVTHILSAETSPTWKGRRGRISEQLVSDLIQVPKAKEKSGCAICGPIPFMNAAYQLLHTAGFEEECLLMFSG